MSMSRDDVNNSPPQSLVDREEYKNPPANRNGGTATAKIYSPSPKGSQHNEALNNLEDLANSRVSYPNHNTGDKDPEKHDREDVESNAQEPSEAGDEGIPQVSYLRFYSDVYRL
jgi:hypothetical protein